MSRPSRPLAPLALAIAALAGPLWPTWIGVQQAQVGRALVAVIALAIAFDLATGRAGSTRPRWATVALTASFVGLTGWAAISAATWGCFCGNSVQSMGDVALLLVVAAVVHLYSSERMAVLILAAATVGVLGAGLLSAAGIADLHANVYSESASEHRLEGVYGNPNYLGFALAMALPAAAVGAARLRRGWRIAAFVAFVALGVLLLATFSRGSLLAAGAGVAAALLIAMPALRSRRVAIATAIAIPALLVAFIASPFYRDQRVAADFGRNAQGVDRKADHSGWTSEALGAVEVSGATLSNLNQPQAEPDAKSTVAPLQVSTTAKGQGVTYPFAQSFHAGNWTWQLVLSAPQTNPKPLGLRWLVSRYDGSVVATGDGELRPGETVDRPLGVAAREPDWFMLHVWTNRAGDFQVERLVTRGQGDMPEEPVQVSTRLLGTGPGALHDAESSYIDSRITGLRLAAQAFASSPLYGIGTERFPTYADTHADYGMLPTHNSYAQVLAELGIVGVLLFLTAIAAVVAAARRSVAGVPLRAASVGIAAAGAVNLLFINALASPGMLLPLIVGLASITGWAGPRPGWLGGTDTTPPVDADEPDEDQAQAASLQAS